MCASGAPQVFIRTSYFTVASFITIFVISIGLWFPTLYLISHGDGFTTTFSDMVSVSGRLCVPRLPFTREYAP